ncbi:MAG TPA: DsrE family protein [Candidatus Kapabacteria bacterium]|nr:DsrE family protein [Candidatus Kapabacteria bacterium]
MKILLIINDAPYGTEKPYNALRIADQLSKEHKSVEVRIFLIGDGVNCALVSQTTPNGYYNIERMIKLAIANNAEVKMCGTCIDARGLRNLPLIEGAQISSMAELTHWIEDSDKILVF